MAEVHELLEGRTGSALGADAGPQYMVFRVTITEADCVVRHDGSIVKPDPRRLVQAIWPTGTAHPWDDWAFADRYILEDTKAQMMFDVRVEHIRGNIPYTGARAAWQWSVSTPSMTQQVRSAQRVEKIENGGWELKGVEPMRLRRWVETTVSTGYSVDVYNHITQQDEPKPVQVTKGFRAVDMVIDVEALQLVGRRMAPNFALTVMPNITPYAKAVNSTSFYGADPYHVRCEHIGITPIEAEIVGQRIPGRAYAIEVVFLWSERPFWPHELWETYEDQNGYMTSVIDARRNPISRYWSNQTLRDFTDLISRLENLG